MPNLEQQLPAVQVGWLGPKATAGVTGHHMHLKSTGLSRYAQQRTGSCQSLAVYTVVEAPAWIRDTTLLLLLLLLRVRNQHVTTHAYCAGHPFADCECSLMLFFWDQLLMEANSFQTCANRWMQIYATTGSCIVLQIATVCPPPPPLMQPAQQQSPTAV